MSAGMFCFCLHKKNVSVHIKLYTYICIYVIIPTLVNLPIFIEYLRGYLVVGVFGRVGVFGVVGNRR